MLDIHIYTFPLSFFYFFAEGNMSVWVSHGNTEAIRFHDMVRRCKCCSSNIFCRDAPLNIRYEVNHASDIVPWLHNIFYRRKLSYHKENWTYNKRNAKWFKRCELYMIYQRRYIFQTTFLECNVISWPDRDGISIVWHFLIIIFWVVTLSVFLLHQPLAAC